MLYDLLRSRLTMGAHPGRPVCSIVAASLWRPMWEKQSLPQKSHLCVVSGLLELLRSFLRALLPASAFSTSCGRLQGPPRSRCGCQVFSCLSCRHPCSASVGGLWISFQMPTLHRECLLGCGHPPWPMTCPSLRCLSKVNTLGRLARDRTSVLDTLSCRICQEYGGCFSGGRN